MTTPLQSAVRIGGSLLGAGVLAQSSATGMMAVGGACAVAALFTALSRLGRGVAEDSRTVEKVSGNSAGGLLGTITIMTAPALALAFVLPANALALRILAFGASVLLMQVWLVFAWTFGWRRLSPSIVPPSRKWKAPR